MVAAYRRKNKDHSACLSGSWTSLLDTLACWNLPLNLHYDCVMYKYMAILHTACIVVSAVHDKKYLLLVLYSLDSYHKRPGYSAVVSLVGEIVITYTFCMLFLWLLLGIRPDHRRKVHKRIRYHITECHKESHSVHGDIHK